MSWVRALAPAVLQIAELQRWSPEEVLRTFVEAEITARDESNSRARLKSTGFPVHKALGEFKVAQYSVPQVTFDCLASLEWIRATENLCLVGPAGTGKSHLLAGLGHAAVAADSEFATSPPPTWWRSCTAASPTTLWAMLIDSLLRSDLIVVDELGCAPLDAEGSQLLLRFVAAAYERRSLGVGSHRPFDQWGTFLPEHTNAVSLLDRLLHHAVVVVTEDESARMKAAESRGGGRSPKT
jgi:DNA replication protein DnaC